MIKNSASLTCYTLTRRGFFFGKLHQANKAKYKHMKQAMKNYFIHKSMINSFRQVPGDLKK